MKNFSDTCLTFLKTFFGTTILERKIFKYLCFMGRKYSQLFCCKEKIAEAIGCCTKTVQRALKRFSEWGWIGRLPRAWQSWLIIIPDEILSLDLDDPKTFENGVFLPAFPVIVPANVHANVPLYSTPDSPSYISTSTEPSTPIQEEKKEEIAQIEQTATIPDCLKKIIPIKQALTLAKKFAERDLIQAVDDGIWYNKQGHRVRDMFNFIYSRAQKSFQKRR